MVEFISYRNKFHRKIFVTALVVIKTAAIILFILNFCVLEK